MDRRAIAKSLLTAAALLAITVGVTMAQTGETPKSKTPAPKKKYSVSQSVDLGGHIVSQSGSAPTYDTLVNIQSGPRMLNQTLVAHSVDGATRTFFDNLETASSGYGGDPYTFSTLRFSKGKIYDFDGSFRRNRQYFDYNLFGNPLVPAGLTTTTGYTFPQVDFSPALFNTVRRITDLNLTLMPISKVSFRAGYTLNIMQGPTFSSVHFGTEALLSQAWRYSTDNWLGAVDFRPLRHTTLSYEQYVTHYKWNTQLQLTDLNLQLANGTPVTLGFDNVTIPSCGNRLPPVTFSPTGVPIANDTCNGFLQYTRVSPIRTLFPTEMFHFVAGDLKSVQITGAVRYTSANSNMPNYFEFFNGLQSRTSTRTSTFAGSSSTRRLNVGADFGLVWNVAPGFILSDQYYFQNWRQPGTGTLVEVDQPGTSMLATPGANQAPVVTSADNFLGQKTNTNTLMGQFLTGPRASVSLGYRFRKRSMRLADTVSAESYPYSDVQNSGLFGVRLQPSSAWRINGDVEVGWSNNTYVQITPRQWQSYQLRTQWKAKETMVSASYVDLEQRNNVANVGFNAHSRAFNASAAWAGSSRYGLDLSYGYMDVYSRTNLCFASSVPPVGSTPVPAGFSCGNATATSTPPGFFALGFYDAPTNFGAITFNISPAKPLRTEFGYSMTAINGNTVFLNPRQVPGSLQSQYQTPFANALWTIAKGWGIRGEWNYYSYGEGSPIGPTLPRSFRANVYTISLHNEF